MSEPWLERWREGRIGWHEQDGNARLKEFWRATGRRVLVPLCGKTPDLLWLALNGNEVTGVELSPIAAESFFDEHELPWRRARGRLPALVADVPAIRIVIGDYLQFDESGFDALYDRASLVALPADRRPDYARHTRRLVADGAYHLLVTLEYDQKRASGPPFSVPADEVLRYWPDLVRVDARSDLDNSPPKFRNLPELVEVTWRRE